MFDCALQSIIFLIDLYCGKRVDTLGSIYGAMNIENNHSWKIVGKMLNDSYTHTQTLNGIRQQFHVEWHSHKIEQLLCLSYVLCLSHMLFALIRNISIHQMMSYNYCLCTTIKYDVAILKS